MVTATRIGSEDLFPTLKALFPIFAGIGFLLLFLYIFSIYNYQKDLNTYFLLSEDRSVLEIRYQDQYDELFSGLDSIKGRKEKKEYLENLGMLNNSLLSIADQMIVNGYKILDLEIHEKEALDLAINDMNLERLKLHSKIEEYIATQNFAAEYVELKNKTEGCYNKVDLESTNYSKVANQLESCSKPLSEQIELISAAGSGLFSETSSYLSKYEHYWALVQQMYSYLSTEKVEQAKKISTEVTKQLKKLPVLQKASDAELNEVLSENILLDLNEVIEEIAEKGIVIVDLREATSF